MRRAGFGGFGNTATAVALFAMAMAFVESACVLYLRTLYGGIDPVARGGRPLGPVPDLLGVEVGREAATLVMLAAAGWLAGRHFVSRAAYFIAAFGIWDVFYYLWLWLFSGWPAGLLDWDVLFLIPLPWWGPVVSPVTIALEMAVGGFLVARLVDAHGDFRASYRALALLFAGMLLMLAAFMWDALGVATGLRAGDFGFDPGVSPVPAEFRWEVFVLGDAVAIAGLALLLLAQRRPWVQ